LADLHLPLFSLIGIYPFSPLFRITPSFLPPPIVWQFSFYLFRRKELTDPTLHGPKTTLWEFLISLFSFHFCPFLISLFFPSGLEIINSFPKEGVPYCPLPPPSPRLFFSFFFPFMGTPFAESLSLLSSLRSDPLL